MTNAPSNLRGSAVSRERSERRGKHHTLFVLFANRVSVMLAPFAANRVTAFVIAIASITLLSVTNGATPATLPADAWVSIYRDTLGDDLAGQSIETITRTHQQVERVFAATSSADRRAQIAALNGEVSPAVIAKLCALRLNWPIKPPTDIRLDRQVGPYTTRYFVHVPADYSPLQRWPLVVHLMPPGPLMVRPALSDELVASRVLGRVAELAKHFPDAVLIAPVPDLRGGFGPSYSGMNAVLLALQDIGEHVRIDTTRVTLRGDGPDAAAAVWNLGVHCPTYFASLNPMGGSVSTDWQRMRLKSLANVAVVFWADAKSPAAKIELAHWIVQRLRLLKYDFQYEESKAGLIEPDDAAVARAAERLRPAIRKLSPSTLLLTSNRPEPALNRVDWLQVWQPLRSGDEKRSFFRNEPGYVTQYALPWNISASVVSPNVIDVSADNVALFTLELGGGLIDFAKPLTVRVNGKVRFEGVVSPDLVALFDDQRRLGRGWRETVAKVDIDLMSTTRPAATSAATKP